MTKQVRHVFTVKRYLDGLSKGKLLGSKCKKCGTLMIPLKPVCMRCGSTNLKEVESKIEGVLRSFTVIHVALPELADKAPYITTIVRLDEGPSIMGRLIGVDPNKPEEIKIGTKVKFEPLKENGKVVVAFRYLSK